MFLCLNFWYCDIIRNIYLVFVHLLSNRVPDSCSWQSSYNPCDFLTDRNIFCYNIWSLSLVPDTGASTTPGISGVIRVSFCIRIRRLVAGSLNRYRPRAGHRQDHSMVSGTQCSIPCHPSLHPYRPQASVEGLETELINGQGRM